MSVKNEEIETYFGRCRCCLSYGYLKNMWSEHKFEGETIIYGEMLVQCFALSWESPEDMEQDQICERCIHRLRDASDFKKVVLDSQEELLQQIDAENIATFKEEPVDEEYLVYKDPKSEPDTMDTEYTIDAAESAESTRDEAEYEEIEFLEEEDAGDANEVVVTDSSLPVDQPKRRKRPVQSTQPDTEEGITKRKWPKKLPKAERYKSYKQYTEEDMRKCMEAIRKGELTPNEAAVKYNIPKKTISSKMKIEPKAEPDSIRDKTYQLIRETTAILTYTNATLYKSKSIRYYCFYCSTDGPHFDDPDDLRSHTRTEHVRDRIEKLEYAMRPFWMNEVLKVDIDNLLCTVCCVVINSWNDMFKHLKEKHNVVLDQAYNRMIPYVLKTDLQCALCKEAFTNFMHLDGHMNAHYNNYVCDDCGDTFLAQNRLKQHVKIHNVGKFPCEMCSKVFSLEKYKRKHEALVHKQLLKFKCLYCPDKFTSEYVRHLHCLEMHKEKIKTITCEMCGKCFTWRQYYLNHLKRKHEMVKKFPCSRCDKRFRKPHELKDHELRHGGDKKYECPICQKRYVSLTSLKQHGRQHKKNK